MSPPSAETCIKRLVKLKSMWIESDKFFELWGKVRHDLYKTPEYKMFLIEVRSRSNYKCTGHCCIKKGRHVHHIIHVYQDPTKAIDPDNGTFLCVACHRKEHKRGITRAKSRSSRSRATPKRHKKSN